MISPLNPFSNKNQINFGYKSILKEEFKDNPEMRKHVKKGLYGGSLKDSVTLEHVHCHSQGGQNKLSNFALATAKNNQARGQEPLAKFLTKDMFESYAKEFEGWEAQRFDNKEYIKGLAETVQREGVDLGLPNIPIGDMVQKGKDVVNKVTEETMSKTKKLSKKELKNIAKHKKRFHLVPSKTITGQIPDEAIESIKRMGKHLDLKV